MNIATNTKGAKKVSLALMVGALGIVYGDIGTSPLYAISEAFFGHYPLARTDQNILGVVSMMFWSLIVVVTVKYIGLILRADNNGEGGIFALLGLLLKKERNNNGQAQPKPAFFVAARSALFSVILIGAALLYGDGIITPAISVLSAAEGLSVITPAARHFQIPVTIGILIILFAIQSKGTNRIGWLFGPVMLLWFASIAILGVLQIIKEPQILSGLNPKYTFLMAWDHGWRVLLVLGAVVLCVTGVEAMYADLGHFGRPAITRTWLFLVFPCLLLNYMGQGAYMLSGQTVPENHLFFAIIPRGLLIPMVALATMATIIASQALISGAFSLTQQAIAMGLFPRLKIVHTNPEVPGQIYLPFINWALLIGCVCLVLSFKTSGALAAAYGIAVTGTMGVTTIVFALVAIWVFGWQPKFLLPLVIPIFLVDISFFSANLIKFMDGGYVPILIGLGVFFVMDTWRWGRTWIGKAYQKKIKDYDLTIESIVHSKALLSAARTNISLVVMASRPIMSLQDNVPPVLAIHYNNWRHLPKHIIFLSIIQTGSPFVLEAERYRQTIFCQDAHNGTLVSVQASYGYMEQPQIRTALLEMKRLHLLKVPKEPRKWLILLGAERFVTKGDTWIDRVRINVFSRMNRLAKPVTDYFGLETDSAVTIETINV